MLLHSRKAEQAKPAKGCHTIPKKIPQDQPRRPRKEERASSGPLRMPESVKRYKRSLGGSPQKTQVPRWGLEGVQKVSRKGPKWELLEIMKIELLLQRELSSAHPKWSLKTGSMTRSIETKAKASPETPYERQMVPEGPWSCPVSRWASCPANN